MKRAAIFLLVGACATVSAPRGMTIAAGPEGTAPDAIVVAFPKGACTGGGEAVFLDEAGNFVSVVAPGTAVDVPFSAGAGHLVMVSNYDVEAGPGTRFFRHRIAPSRQRGVILDVPRRDGRNCAGRGLPRPNLVTASEALAAARPLVWLRPQPEEGARWFAEHRARIDELLAAKKADEP